MTPERFQRITQVLQQRQPDLTVITDEVHKGRNLSAILRSCDAVGIDHVHCVIPSKGFRPYRGTSLGTDKWVEVRMHATLDAPLAQLREAGYNIFAADAGVDAVDYRSVDYTGPTALLMGAEREGLSAKARSEATQVITIPMLGMVESFNVSVACAAILLEAQRQRVQAGLYDRQRLDAATFSRRFFQWAHPVLAAYCDSNGLEYPPVREDGEVYDPSDWYQRVRNEQRLNAGDGKSC
jgi:tRNA (guanosine-2'-O-)-methyltransferase